MRQSDIITQDRILLTIKSMIDIGDQTVYFYFFKRPERYNQEVLSHSFKELF